MRRLAGLFALASVGTGLGLGACHGSSSTTPPAVIVAVDYGTDTVVLHFDPDARVIILQLHGKPLLRFPADGLQLGVVASVTNDGNYDPTPIFQPSELHPPPEDLVWETIETVTPRTSVSGLPSGFELGFTHGHAASLGVEVIGDRFALTLVPKSADVAYVRLRPRLVSGDAHEGLYGLGEHFDGVDNRGKIRALQVEADGELEGSYNQVHVPVPFVLGTSGFGMFVEDRHPAVFAVAAPPTTDVDAIDAIVGLGLDSAKGLRFHLFAAENPLDLTQRYYAITGAPKLPPRWALGPWLWRNDNANQAQVEGDLQAMRDLDLAHTALWVDRPYATGVNTFDFLPKDYPDPKAMVDHAHALGFRFGLWHTPYLDEKDATTAALRAEAASFYPSKSGLLLNKWGRPIDLTNAAAVTFWQKHLKAYTDLGVEGWKLDFAEDVAPGFTLKRNEWAFADGSDERTMHALFPLLYHQTYFQTFAAGEDAQTSGGFLLGRHAHYGDQVNAPVIWPGDLDSSFQLHREPVEKPGARYLAVGGLPASVAAGLSLGPSGFPFFGADTGGYIDAPPDKELFTRWFEQTALSTVMQIGNGASTVAWEASTKTGFDDEMLGWYRTYTRLHLRLFPYEWTFARRLLVDGRPIARPIGLAYPSLGVHPSDEYLFGDALLVAPVLTRGGRERQVIFPQGNWVDWWTGEVHAGSAVASPTTIAAPLERLPLFLLAGSVVPMLRPTIDTLGPTTLPDRVDSYATTPGLLWARVVPGPKTSFALFDGSTIEQSSEGTGAAMTTTLTTKDGAEFKNGFVFEVMRSATSVAVDGAVLTKLDTPAALDAVASGWTMTPDAGGMIRVKVPSGTHTVVLGG